MRNKKQLKKVWRFWGGVSGLLLGAWIIFYLKYIGGFIPAIIGAYLLTVEKK